MRRKVDEQAARGQFILIASGAAGGRAVAQTILSVCDGVVEMGTP